MEAGDVVAVLDKLASAGIRVGISGGWGIDALLRHQTRPHSDLDLGLSVDAVEDAIRELAILGYALTLDERPARLELRGDRGQVDLHPIVWAADGRGVQTGFDGQEFVYPPGSLDATGIIAGRIVRCATPAVQWAFHQGYEPGPVDRQDMLALAQEFGEVALEVHASGNAAGH